MEKKIYRSRTEKMVGGVAGGIGKYLDVDPIFIRLVFIVATFYGGFGVIAYIACLVLVPKEPLMASQTPEQPLGDGQPFADGTTKPAGTQAVQESGNGSKKRVFGAFMVIIGALLLVKNLVPAIHFHEYFPVLLILLGAWLLLNPNKKGTTNEL